MISLAGLVIAVGLTPHGADAQAELSAVQRSAIADSVATVMDSVFGLSGQFSYSFADSAGHVTSGIAASTWVLARDKSGWRVVHLHMSDPPASAK